MRIITNNSSNPIPSDGQTWTHVAMVYNSATGGQLYINGLQSGAATPGYGTLVTNSQQLKMGTGISSMLNAELDDVRIFNRALTSNEITNLSKYRNSIFISN